MCELLFSDRKYETVVLPIFGVPTPFHISTVKVRDFLVCWSHPDRKDQETTWPSTPQKAGCSNQKQAEKTEPQPFGQGPQENT